MKTRKPSLHNILLAAALALPLIATSGAATAEEAGRHDPMDARGAPGGAPEEHGGGEDRGHPGPGGPDGPRGPGGPGPGGHEGFGPGSPPFGAPGMGPGGHAPALRGVELSEAQQDKVFAILHAQEPYLRDQGKAAAKAHEALRAMAEANPYDDAKAAALAQAGAQAMANIALQRVRTEQKLLAVLTPEQRKKQADKDADRKDGKPAGPQARKQSDQRGGPQGERPPGKPGDEQPGRPSRP